jgi:exodeoxyribonuclease V alpha subunit
MASCAYPVDKLDSLISDIEAQHKIEYAAAQKASLELAAKHGVMALTGGPGTGKTTTVRGILLLFDALNLKTMLCAPTGRAAKRLSETCLRRATTIHRMLGAKPNDNGELVFTHNEDKLLKADVVIVDETSMVDISLMHSLLQALKPECRLILVGDADQLPSVGPGNVFADIIKSDTVPTISLTEIFRQAENSGIVRCAHDVNKGIVPDFTKKYPDLFFMRRHSEEEIADTVTELYGRRLPDNMGIEPSQIQVLSPTRKHAAGTVSLNAQLREAVNSPHETKREKQFGNFLYRVGDKVMQIKNNYDIMWTTPDMELEQAGVFNGDIGMVKDIDYARETVIIDYEDKIVDYLFEQRLELEPAFAMTVHKSQGSEYPAVILAMTSAAPQLLSRGVLYTAMTRAKNLLVIVGSHEVLEKMVMNDKKQRRYSGLRFRLAGGVNSEFGIRNSE